VKIPNSKFQIPNSKLGFTLLEITVVIFIIGLLAAIVLANYRGGEKQSALLRSTHRLAQDLRRAEEMAISSKSFYNAFPKGGYGIYFTEGPNSYILFADCNNNKIYDGGIYVCPDCTGGSCIENVQQEKIEELFLEEGIKIKNLQVDSFPVDFLPITFAPPDPTVTIAGGNEAAITLCLKDNESITRTVTVNIAGLIDTKKP